MIPKSFFRTFILLALLAAPSLGAAAAYAQSAVSISTPPEGQVKDDLFAGTEKFAQGAKDVTEVNLGPDMLGAVAGKTNKADLAHKMDYMVIRTYKYDKPGMYKMEDLDVYRARLQDGSWNCSIHVRSHDSSTDICSRGAADAPIKETVILTADPKSLTFIHMRGKASLADLGNLGSQLDKAKTGKGSIDSYDWDKAPAPSVPQPPQ
jgi:hypothetical protein